MGIFQFPLAAIPCGRGDAMEILIVVQVEQMMHKQLWQAQSCGGGCIGPTWHGDVNLDNIVWEFGVLDDSCRWRVVQVSQQW